ncbi:hypothetical protein NRB16_03100 [Pseudomonas sp. LJDD11]|uniref:hypothetical protein n=1 Tax=Pseudomonas sp. LJDD11 TaxID=2931984 RepID=UPI00211CAF1B|nr:hypothetical protein [Pseudomonas sp. LJDD11]MCQ9422516.1 hypothetical protein [Pseudomonas sp. LJDD11]
MDRFAFIVHPGGVVPRTYGVFLQLPINFGITFDNIAQDRGHVLLWFGFVINAAPGERRDRSGRLPGVLIADAEAGEIADAGRFGGGIELFYGGLFVAVIAGQGMGVEPIDSGHRCYD